MGRGPYRLWRNRREGLVFGAWRTEYNNTVSGYKEWKYPEFKGCFAEVSWLQLEMDEGLITCIPHSSDLYVQVMKPEVPPKSLERKESVALPDFGLGFLHVIPAIGNKFLAPSQLGPQSATASTAARYRGTVSFRFGEL